MDDGGFALGWLILGSSAVACVAAAADGIHRSYRRRALAADPGQWLVPVRSLSGVRAICAAAGPALLLSLGYQLFLSLGGHPGTGRLGMLMHAAASVAGGAAIFAHVGRRWSTSLAYCAIGILTLAACVVIMTVCHGAFDGAGGFSLITLMAVLFGFVGMGCFWRWLAGVWRQQLDTNSSNRVDPAWTTAGRLVPVCARCFWLIGTMGVLVAVVTLFWRALAA